MTDLVPLAPAEIATPVQSVKDAAIDSLSALHGPGRCICGPDSSGEAPDMRPDCMPCNQPAADIGEVLFLDD